MEGLDLSTFGKRSVRVASRSFPIQVVSYDLNHVDGKSDTVTGIDLSSPEKPTVTVFLRPRKAKENAEEQSSGTRPEVVNFAIDVLGIAMKSNSRAEVEEAMNDPLAKVYTDIGGVLLADGAYFDEKSGLWSASWLRSLSKSAGQTEIISPVMARLNEPYIARSNSRMTASLDVVYPEMKTLATTFADLERYAIDTMKRSSNGISFVVLRVINTVDGEMFARMIRPGTKLKDGVYVIEDVDAVMNRFWCSFESDWVDNLIQAIDSGAVKVEVFPGVRYYFISKGLEAVIEQGEKHSARYRMDKDEENGFLASTVVLKEHEGDDGEMFPIGCHPLLPFDAKPQALAGI